MFDFRCWKDNHGVYHLNVNTDQFDDFNKVVRIVGDIEEIDEVDNNRFNVHNYQGNYVMHCNTVKDAVTFCQYLDSENYKWCNGERYNHTDVEVLWNINYRDRTVFCFNNGRWTDLSRAKELGYTILEFNDFNWEKEN